MGLVHENLFNAMSESRNPVQSQPDSALSDPRTSPIIDTSCLGVVILRGRGVNSPASQKKWVFNSNTKRCGVGQFLRMEDAKAKIGTEYAPTAPAREPATQRQTPARYRILNWAHPWYTSGLGNTQRRGIPVQ